MAAPTPALRFPLLPPAILLAAAGSLALLFLLIEVRVIEYAYARIGVPHRHMMALMLLTLSGSYFNIPLWRIRSGDVTREREVVTFGVKWLVPMTPGQATIVAVNVGGALIPVLLSFYILAVTHVTGHAAVVGGLVTVVTWWLARPVRGVGIVVPTFAAPVAAAVAAWLTAPANAPAVACVGGTVGTLVGADLLNLGSLRDLGAPVASIGGAGTFDGIFVTGVLAALLA